MHTWLSSGSISIDAEHDEQVPLQDTAAGNASGAAVVTNNAAAAGPTNTSPAGVGATNTAAAAGTQNAHGSPGGSGANSSKQQTTTSAGVGVTDGAGAGGDGSDKDRDRSPNTAGKGPDDPLLEGGGHKRGRGHSRSNNSLAASYAASRDISNIEISHREPRFCNAKYTEALKNLLPWRPKPKDPSYLPGHSAGLFSFMSLSWMSSLMYKTRHGLRREDLWKLHEVDSAELNYRRLERLWADEQQRAEKDARPPSIRRAVTSSVLTRTIITAIISLFYTAVMFLLTSHIMRLTLDYVNSPAEDVYEAWMLIGLVVGLNLVRALAFNAMFVVAVHSAMRVVGALQGMVFQKVLRLQTGGDELSGQVSNIINNDMERIMEAVISIVFLPGLPVTTLAALVYSWYIVGPWSLLGYLAIVLFGPLMKNVTTLIGRIRAAVCKVSDSRVSLMTEILNNIRLIKMYSWEDSFSKNIENLRGLEVSKVRHIGLLQTLNLTLSPVMSSIALLVIMVAITLSGLPISAANAFTLASVLNCFQFSMGTVPFMLRSIAEASVALTRVQKILLRREHKSHGYSVMQNSLALNLQHATFEWLDADDVQSKDSSAQNKDAKEGEGADTKGVSNGKQGNNPPAATAAATAATASAAADQSHGDEATVNGATTGAGAAAGAEEVDVSRQALRGLSLSVPKGKLIGICGGVGSGKSSLLSAICGDMNLVSGEVQVNGRVALVSQQAWIYNTSLRNNILMGMTYEKTRYDAMLQACALTTDLQILPDDDNTEIGEKGINLSGGQKQRVSLGRAVYSDREIYLLDDPLSAVDTRVARHIFQQCINGLLKGKTVLLVTHALHFLEQCDEVVLVKDGQIAERGTHADLMARGGAYTDFVSYDKMGQQEHTEEEAVPQSASTSSENSDSGNQQPSSTLNTVSDKDGAGQLIAQEGRESGSVKGSVYRNYIKASGGWCSMLAVLLGVMLFTVTRLFSVVWQQWWLDAGDGLMDERLKNMTLLASNDSSIGKDSSIGNDSSYSDVPVLSDEDLRGDISKNPNLYMYQAVHTALFLSVIVAGIIKGYVAVYTLTKGSRRLHNVMFRSVMRAPTSFFDVTPTSRIITRFSKDIDEMDYRIPTFFDMLIQAIFFMTASSLLVCFFFPYFSIVLVLVGVVFIVLGQMLDRGVKEFKRFESTQKSPVVQSVTSCISGLQLIRAYGQEEMFARKFYDLVDDHTMVMLVFRLSNRWFTFRMDLLAIIIMGSITALCVLTKGTFSTAIAGLALTSVNGMCQFLPFLMRIKSEFESRMTSVERIIEYAYNIPSEAPRHVAGVVPEDGSWPSKGAIKLTKASLRYRPNLPLVLNEVSADIAPGERIGVVGRTGAGKSSLINALLRVVELDSGSIHIDGVDIKTLGLHTLRSAVSVIPQDPVLFQGTIRYNLDPFEEHTDEAVTAAAQRSRLWSVIERNPAGLLAAVEAGGQNFSVGERQLICLTRAVLRNSKVLLLDEATASVDPETDQLIQAALQSAFADATLVTVAHRLNTISHYDRVMVMDAGQVREFDTPVALLEQEGSLFRQMLSAIGVTTAQQLHNLS